MSQFVHTSLAAPALALACSLTFALAQQPTQRTHGNANLPPPIPGARPDDDADQLSPTERMLRDAEIKRREAEYKENLGRAKEAAQLASEVRDAFRRQKSLAAADLKKIVRIEKFARAIRDDAGGDDDESQLKDPPGRLEEALERLSEMCEEFRKKVEKTPRLVVSASVITSANQLIALARHIRALGG